MIPRFKPTLGIKELGALLTPANESDIVRFENAFASLMSQKHAISFPYGRTGLALTLDAMSLKGKEIICPAYTCVVVPHAIVTSGNEPVFIDSQESDFNMDLTLAHDAITKNTGAIIATSIFGHPVDLEKLSAIRKAYPHIKVIQDCAHSFAASYKEEEVHRHGDAALFALNISKTITSIFGGMVTTDDSALATQLREIRLKRLQEPTSARSLKMRLYLIETMAAFSGLLYGLTNLMERAGFLNKMVKYYNDTAIDMPPDYLKSFTPIQAKIGRIQIERYDNIIKRRRFVAATYQKELSAIKEINLPPVIKGATYSHYAVRVENKKNLVEYALKHGVQLGEIINYSIPEMKVYKNRPGNKFPCPVAKNMSESTINLPIGNLSDKQIEQVILMMKQYYET